MTLQKTVRHTNTEVEELLALAHLALWSLSFKNLRKGPMLEFNIK